MYFLQYIEEKNSYSNIRRTIHSKRPLNFIELKKKNSFLWLVTARIVMFQLTGESKETNMKYVLQTIHIVASNKRDYFGRIYTYIYIPI